MPVCMFESIFARNGLGGTEIEQQVVVDGECCVSAKIILCLFEGTQIHVSHITALIVGCVITSFMNLAHPCI